MLIKNKTKLSVIIPVFNEGINLPITLKVLSAIIEVPHEIIVVYDIPNDDSIPVITSIQQKYPQIRGAYNNLGRGVLNAVKKGIEDSKGDYILVTAADDIGPVMSIQDMLNLMDKGFDLVSCTRYAHGGIVLGGSPIGRPLSRLANKLFKIISAAALTDSTIGIKMFRKDIFKKIKFESRPIGFAFAFELAIKAQLLGMKLGEVPVVSLNRLYGRKSSFKFGSWVREYSRWFIFGLKNYKHMYETRNNVQIRVPLKMQK